ncbi:hypothetical protein DPMN_191468 [Dreissena polymorpha]|uniref:Sortin nexin 17/31 FERM domain-containing protein n=1 Tax=Dreissena polymorpha TaxID=45954 RepID=A0A9D4BBX8_DREPO|nr:hypothetical protein DPMN_191468 [Dreissena polymorpha]
MIDPADSTIDLPEDFVNYFGLYLVCKEANDGEMTIIRKLQDFMSPYISRKTATKQGVHKIVLRKTYWDSSFDDELLFKQSYYESSLCSGCE